MILGFCIFFCNFVQAFLIQNFLIKFFGTKSVWGHVARQRLISIVLIFLPLELGSLLNINDILLTLINFVILFIFCEKYLLGNNVNALLGCHDLDLSCCHEIARISVMECSL